MRTKLVCVRVRAVEREPTLAVFVHYSPQRYIDNELYDQKGQEMHQLCVTMHTYAWSNQDVSAGIDIDE